MIKICRQITPKKRFLFICCYMFCVICIFASPMAYPLDDDAKNVEKLMATEKKAGKEKEKVLIEQFYNEGKRLFDSGDYEGAIDQFSRVLEIDPKHKGAKDSIKKIKNKLDEKRKIEAPNVMAQRLMRSGRVKYGKQDYEGAIEDFQDALVLDYTNKDALEWLKRVRRRQSLEETGVEERDLTRETEVATKKKEAKEKAAMLEVETAYLPPEKRERKPVEIEEMVSLEEEKEEKARQELMKKLESRMVPAVSLAEADIRDVIRQLMEITGVTIVIDEGALAEATEKGPLKITFSTVTPLPLLDVLNIALRATMLSYRVEPNYIWVSTPAKLEKEDLVTRTYRLRYGVRRVRKVQLKEFETKTSE